MRQRSAFLSSAPLWVPSHRVCVLRTQKASGLGVSEFAASKTGQENWWPERLILRRISRSPQTRPKEHSPRLWGVLPFWGRSSFTQGIREKLIRLERLGVRIPDPAEVVEYLVRFPELISVVDAVVRLAAKMLPEAQLTLQVYHNPEIDDQYLVLYARFASYDETTIERIRAVRDKYRPLFKNTSCWLLLTTDFRPPE